ncbi:AAA-like domain-containing protein [Hymenobacter cavernae]|uniref:ATP-binding protein n=1 Tax=Hymenobacter cavernae TaxID=2044852 RepID=A0ABQ1UVD0_9BACT|nr:AAA-like domain-containing protein [Hymenobacter cavernae]GGF27895.1 hypothetical protein GCM10011383_44480 [Hymenobacter cavernae]
MNNKLLKSYTIIPDHLYVRREADRLVEFIINDTGRPGYVLVARQMGKTNLLLNAKAQLIGPDDACVYLDFSNSFRNARECFRYIIDLAIDTNPEKLHFLSGTIKKMRNENDEVDHVEHLLELRTLLQVIKGRLIVLIDEVDAMTTVPFSDVVFKQIRSVYFSRTNYPVLHKLNYILSGVGEPSKLIKDPKISPFNIGQEIFLGDFSYSEYLEFLKKSKLNISNDAAERIYYWANGNPRMTYEICSSVEDILMIESAIEVEVIDRLIHMMYLTTFDRVPLDNIRSMIQGDQEMARAVISLKKRDLQSITIAQRRQLYLLGVVGANFENEKIVIKNRIIEHALSDEWLAEIVDDETNLNDQVTAALIKKDYDTVISLLEKNIDKYDGVNFIVLQQAIINAFFNKGKYLSIVEHFENKDIEVNIGNLDSALSIRLESLFLYASALDTLKMYSKAFDVLFKIHSYGFKNVYYYKSLLAIAQLSSQTNVLSEIDISNYTSVELDQLGIYKMVIDEVATSEYDISREDINSVLFGAHLNLGMYFKERNEHQLALNNFTEAFSRSSTYIQPFVLFQMAATTESQNDRNNLYIETIDAITNNKIVFRDCLDGDIFRFSYLDVLNLVNYCLVFSKEYAFILIKYFYNEEIKMLRSRNAILFKDEHLDQLKAREELFVISFNEFAGSLNKEQLKLGYNIFKESKLINIIHGRSFIEAALKYDFLPELDTLDFSYFSQLALAMAQEKGDLALSQDIIKYLRNNYFNLPGKPVAEIALIDFYEMEIMKRGDNIYERFEKSKAILSTLKGYQANEDSSVLIDNKTLDIIRDIAFKTYTELLKNFNSDIDTNLGGRNKKVTVQYKNGAIMNDKLKRFEKDIAKGLCKIIQI